MTDFDLCVIGGGINGVGIARDAAGRGHSVLLVEAQDLAGATSSASTKLIHGGLRYLEHYEFRLVREALKERERLLSIAPHIIWPLRFVLPHDKSLRPAWMIRLGLFLYDHLGGRRKLQKSRGLDLSYQPEGSPLQEKYKRAFTYADCWVDDARLVILNAIDAADRGATILTRTACTHIAPDTHGDHWQVTVQNQTNGRSACYTAKKIVNAAGPWVRAVLDRSNLATEKTPQIRMVKGSHIIVPRLYNGDHAYILQEPDKRIVFAIPYEHDFTLVGTTDVEFHGDPDRVEISKEEIEYLCAAINNSFKKKINPSDVVSTYSGVRPLLDDGDDNASAVTRDYKLIHDTSHGPEILSVFGGKITTYRTLAEHAVDDLFGGRHWTAGAPLPGGDIDHFWRFLDDRKTKHRWMSDEMAYRYARAYGTNMDKIIGKAKSAKGLGKHYGDDLYEAEVRYLIKHEWARTVEDILWRRTKLGLHIGKDTLKNLKLALPDLIKEIVT